MPPEANSISGSIALIVPQRLVKTVKDCLHEIGSLDKRNKIHRLELDDPHIAVDNSPRPDPGISMFIVPTTWVVEDSSPAVCHPQKIKILQSIGLQEHAQLIWYHIQPIRAENTAKLVQGTSKLGHIIDQWQRSLPPELSAVLVEKAVSTHQWSYTIYPPLFLLPSSSFARDPWAALLTVDFQPYREKLLASICKAFKVTHIALNGAIPANSADTNTNILRSPTRLTPLYGGFGPDLAQPPAYEPTAADFESAFWCSTTQNGIYQTWAPRYTMFSKGNLSEKARILNLTSLTRAGLGGLNPTEISAVDLYAGIGYFAFSYIKAGVGRVLCWEINSWSVEGLKRGATKNGWTCKAVEGENKHKNLNREQESVGEDFDIQEQLVVFKESNERAAERLDEIRPQIPPVRHVNCGFLPSSSASWKTAVQLLDGRLGGWIHAHENVNVKDLQTKKHEVLDTFTALVNVRWPRSHGLHVSCEHLEIVKSYGPGISHCVFDIAVLAP
ncbi:MAG: hypothetical protein Q9195_008736 [Heterodermia aff. obscurata]